MNAQCGRWPPVYDFEGLAEQIRSLVESELIFGEFYDRTPADPPPCQGDVVGLASPVPYVDSEGDVSLREDNEPAWLVVGNTCDIARKGDAADYCAMAPLFRITPVEPLEVRSAMRRYSVYRRFYLPDWQNDREPGYYADLTLICPIEKRLITAHDCVLARMLQKSWLLLHSCLVRFLARDDGRHA